MAGSAIRASHLVGDERVQDPYCLRCQPQVMGAVLDLLRQAATTLLIEANGVSDNPLIFPSTGRTTRPVGRQLPRRAGGLRRRHDRHGRLRDRLDVRAPHRHAGRPGAVGPAGLPDAEAGPELRLHDPAGHRRRPGLGEQAAAFPASVDSIPTSANQEDHVSMAAHGARRWRSMTANCAAVIGIEALAAAQGCDFHAPLPRASALEAARAVVRAVVPTLAEDRYFHPGHGGRQPPWCGPR
jgi:histidine ammonia-lyase